mmetsp:Transcript_114261/g.287162  ORF Transcript_114261/g.287162 Transcript_114261/m.287162 type:complete len:227 (+) Transcript_114261:547-1227(+)
MLALVATARTTTCACPRAFPAAQSLASSAPPRTPVGVRKAGWWPASSGNVDYSSTRLFSWMTPQARSTMYVASAIRSTSSHHRAWVPASSTSCVAFWPQATKAAGVRSLRASRHQVVRPNHRGDDMIASILNKALQHPASTPASARALMASLHLQLVKLPQRSHRRSGGVAHHSIHRPPHPRLRRGAGQTPPRVAARASSPPQAMALCGPLPTVAALAALVLPPLA